MKKTISILLVFLLAFLCASPVTAYAETDAEIIKITKQQMREDAGYYMEQALKYARDNATAKRIVKIYVPSGEYELGRTLHIYSNTSLILKTDTYLKKTFSDSNMLKCGVMDEVNTRYSGYQNMTVYGGIWDGDFQGNSCAMRFAHCKNVTIKKVEIRNIRNAHHLELAGAANFTLAGCKFSGYQRTTSGDGTAVQIDVLHNAYHFPAYEKFDDTPCKNITVRNCEFRNLYAGVGTRSGVIGSYFSNIKILNNRFYNIKDKAIDCFNYVNSKITGNRVVSAAVGILFEYYPDSAVANKLYLPNDKNAEIKIRTNSKTVISDNTLVIQNTSGRYNSAGIAVYGGVLAEDEAASMKLISGEYFVSNLKILSNTVKVQDASATGIWLEYVKNSKIAENTIRTTIDVNGGVNGVTSNTAWNNSFYQNNITKFDNSLAFRNRSVNNRISTNQFRKPRQYGIAIDTTSSVTKFSKNTYIKYGKAKVYRANAGQ